MGSSYSIEEVQEHIYGLKFEVEHFEGTLRSKRYSKLQNELIETNARVLKIKKSDKTKATKRQCDQMLVELNICLKQLTMKVTENRSAAPAQEETKEEVVLRRKPKRDAETIIEFYEKEVESIEAEMLIIEQTKDLKQRALIEGKLKLFYTDLAITKLESRSSLDSRRNVIFQKLVHCYKQLRNDVADPNNFQRTSVDSSGIVDSSGREDFHSDFDSDFDSEFEGSDWSRSGSRRRFSNVHSNSSNGTDFGYYDEEIYENFEVILRERQKSLEIRRSHSKQSEEVPTYNNTGKETCFGSNDLLAVQTDKANSSCRISPPVEKSPKESCSRFDSDDEESLPDQTSPQRKIQPPIEKPEASIIWDEEQDVSEPSHSEARSQNQDILSDPETHYNPTSEEGGSDLERHSNSSRKIYPPIVKLVEPRPETPSSEDSDSITEKGFNKVDCEDNTQYKEEDYDKGVNELDKKRIMDRENKHKYRPDQEVVNEGNFPGIVEKVGAHAESENEASTQYCSNQEEDEEDLPECLEEVGIRMHGENEEILYYFDGEDAAEEDRLEELEEESNEACTKYCSDQEYDDEDFPEALNLTLMNQREAYTGQSKLMCTESASYEAVNTNSVNNTEGEENQEKEAREAVAGQKDADTDSGNNIEAKIQGESCPGEENQEKQAGEAVAVEQEVQEVTYQFKSIPEIRIQSSSTENINIESPAATCTGRYGKKGSRPKPAARSIDYTQEINKVVEEVEELKALNEDFKQTQNYQVYADIQEKLMKTIKSMFNMNRVNFDKKSLVLYEIVSKDIQTFVNEL